MPCDMIGNPAILNGELVALQYGEHYITGEEYNGYFRNVIEDIPVNLFPRMGELGQEWVEFQFLTEEERINLRILSFEEWKKIACARDPNRNPNAIINSRTYEILKERCERWRQW